jgi:adenine/guanine phosphoribosyltransferase-like PRPP-binding protein
LKAAEQLVKMAQAEVAAIFVVIELSKLDGRKILSAPVIDALISYSD